ncbi:MAG: hypothetical protein ACJ8LG_06110 [Massilia sp.]
MGIETLSAGATPGHNEDLVAVYENEGVIDVVIIDGGTSVADRDFIDADMGDVVWFVRTFAESLGKAIGKGRSQAESVLLATTCLRAAFEEKTGGASIPLYAWPIAAMTWIRITHTSAPASLDLYCLGDCKALLLQPGGSVVDLDPYVNPQELVLQNEIARLAEHGVADPAERRRRLTPMLRERRAFLNSSASPTVLCLKPNGAFAAREHRIQAGAGSMLLAMTDGFYRLVDTYGVYSNEELAHLCRQRGLKSMLDELREVERARAPAESLSVKSADDASAVIWSALPG